MKGIPRHATDASLARRQVELKKRVLEATLEPARSNPELLNQLFLNAIGCAGSVSVADPGSPEICEMLRLGSASARILFAVAAASPGPVERPLGDGIARYFATGPNASAHAGNFRLGFFTAAVCRDRAALDELSAVPVDVLRRSPSKADECLYLFADVLQGLWKRDGDLGARIKATLEATDPSKVAPSAQDFTLNVLVPEIELIFRFVTEDRGGFDEALVFSLERHKKYWNKGDRKLDPIGWLSLGPLGVMSCAFDAGWHTAVESDYLPAALSQGTCT